MTDSTETIQPEGSIITTDSPIYRLPEENPLFTKDEITLLETIANDEAPTAQTALGALKLIIPKLKNLTVPKQTVKDSFGEKI